MEQHQEIFNFTRGMIAFRCAHPILSQEAFYTDAEIQWFAPQGDLPNWFDPKLYQFVCLIHEAEQHSLCLLFNAANDAVAFRLPPSLQGTQWHIAVDTAGKAPHDLFAAGEEPLWDDPQYTLSPRSSVILLARRIPEHRSPITLTEFK